MHFVRPMLLNDKQAELTQGFAVVLTGTSHLSPLGNGGAVSSTRLRQFVRVA